MANETTMNKLYEMRLSAAAKAYRDQEMDGSYASMGFDERFSMLVDAEWDSRRINKRTRLLRSASFSVKYIRPPQLLDELALARESDEYRKWQKRYIACDLLIIDDWLLVNLTEKEARETLEIIEARHGERSTVLCSQYAPGGWHTKLGEGAIADAVIDRLVHNPHTIHIGGSESMRKRTSKL